MVTKTTQKFKDWLQIVELLILFILFLFILLPSAEAQICDLSTQQSFPPTPYVNAYLKFDGTGDYLKTNDIDALEFDTTTTESFEISARIKVERAFTPQYILGKYYSKGWMIGYHTNESGYMSINMSTGWKNIFYLGADTSWHEYRIIYNRASKTLNTYVDGSLTNTYANFYYGDIQNTSAFSVGNVGFFANYGPQSINVPNVWFKGSVDYIKVSANSQYIINYDYNECAGQFTKDSASYTISDRTIPGETSCGAKHMMLGFYPCADTCDPEWVRDDVERNTNFSPLGEGLRSIVYEGSNQLTVPSQASGITEWNNNLVVCGAFNEAGGVPVKNIAKWNGSVWSSIGNGFNYEPQHVIVYRNELYAAGFFDTAIGFGETRHIARWDGTAWKPLGIGLDDAAVTMTVYNDELIVAGFFTAAGEVYSPKVAKWNGSEWSAMSVGMSGPVYTLCVYNGELYAGGSFTYASDVTCRGLAKWSGSSWKPVGTGAIGGDKTVRTLKVFNGELYAGGSFIYMNNVTCYNIAKYNGTVWSSLGEGVKGYSCTSSQGYLTDLEVFNNELYATGLFTKIGSIAANKIAKWNGSNWCSLEYGVDLYPRDMHVYDNSLVIAGDLQSASGRTYNNIVRYTPESLTGTGNNNITPQSFKLEQNYPNPFNPSTIIKYSVASNGSKIKIGVYDIQGRFVAELVNQSLNAGSYEVSFNGAGLSSGVYLYSMVVDGKLLVTKKMLMIK